MSVVVKNAYLIYAVEFCMKAKFLIMCKSSDCTFIVDLNLTDKT